MCAGLERLPERVYRLAVKPHFLVRDSEVEMRRCVVANLADDLIALALDDRRDVVHRERAGLFVGFGLRLDRGLAAA